MRYFKNPNDNNNIYAYDETVDHQLPYLQTALDNSWEEVAESDLPQSEPAPEPTAAEKLAAAGLSVDDLKSLLGIK